MATQQNVPFLKRTGLTWTSIAEVAGSGQPRGDKKPEAFSILSFLSDSRPLYLLEMHGVALLFFLVLYAPFAIVDLVRCKRL